MAASIRTTRRRSPHRPIGYYRPLNAVTPPGAGQASPRTVSAALRLRLPGLKTTRPHREHNIPLPQPLMLDRSRRDTIAEHHQEDMAPTTSAPRSRSQAPGIGKYAQLKNPFTMPSRPAYGPSTGADSVLRKRKLEELGL